MNTRKIYFSLIFIIAGAIAVFIFWYNPLLLSFVLTVLFFIKHKIIPIKIEFLWFCISGFLGTLVESIIMLSGAWKYALISLFNFPIWLLFLWGFAGTVGISLFEGLTTNKERINRRR